MRIVVKSKTIPHIDATVERSTWRQFPRVIRSSSGRTAQDFAKRRDVENSSPLRQGNTGDADEMWVTVGPVIEITATK